MNQKRFSCSHRSSGMKRARAVVAGTEAQAGDGYFESYGATQLPASPLRSPAAARPI